MFRSVRAGTVAIAALLSIFTAFLVAGAPAALAATTVSINGTVTASDPAQSGRLFRDGTASTCAHPKSGAALYNGDGTTQYHYDAYTFVGTPGTCVTATLTVTSGGADQGFLTGYSTFNPAAITAGYLADSGLSTNISNPPATISFLLPSSGSVVLVVSDVNPSSVDVPYTLTVSGAQLPTPTIRTTPSAGVNAGGRVSDTASVTGGNAPSGAVTFKLFGPADTTCTGTPVFTNDGTLAAGSASSGNYRPTVAGTYHWTATYNGDTRNNPVSSGCADEPVTISAAGLDHLVLSPASASIPFGTSQAYTAEGFDQFGNDRGPVSGVTYSIDGAGTCTGNACTGPPGSYTVTGTKNGKTGTASLTVTKAATTTTLSASNPNPGVNEPVTFTATVTPQTGTVTPTGTVSFFIDGSSTPAAVVPVDSSGHAAFTTTFGGGSHSVVAVYSGDGNYQPSTSAPATTVNVACDQTITGTHGSLIVTHGTTCVSGATITGGISVAKGATLDIENSTVQGSITASKPNAVRICGSTTGSINVTGATGPVLIGDPTNNCPPNTIKGSILAVDNTGGLHIIDNTVTGTVTAHDNPGAVITGNHH
ncbi:MAG: Ig-like domain repeat protein [Jatrophihabitans sp.]